MPYWSKYGTLNAYSHEEYAENSTLWTIEYIFMKELAGEDPEPKVIELANFIEVFLKVEDGLYDQLPHKAGNHDDATSNDQITGFMALSCRYNLGFHKEIWKEIKRQTFRYDNLNPESPSWKRFLHPRDIIVYGMMAGSKLWYLLAPIVFIAALVSCMKPKGVTSGKLLIWTRINAIRNDWIRDMWLKFFNWVIRGGYGHAFRVYFGRTGHPMLRLLDIVYPR